MDGAHFPITPDALPADLSLIERDEPRFLAKHGLDVSRIAVNHPGGSSGFRIARNGASVVYIPDNELDPPGEPVVRMDELIAFCARADVVIHSAQYLDSDMPMRRSTGYKTRQTLGCMRGDLPRDVHSHARVLSFTFPLSSKPDRTPHGVRRYADFAHQHS